MVFTFLTFSNKKTLRGEFPSQEHSLVYQECCQELERVEFDFIARLYLILKTYSLSFNAERISGPVML